MYLGDSELGADVIGRLLRVAGEDHRVAHAEGASRPRVAFAFVAQAVARQQGAGVRPSIAAYTAS